MRRETRTSCAPAAAALPPWPQAAAAVLNRQRAQHKAASFMRNRPTPSGSPESPWAAGRSPRLQTSGRPGAQRTRSELSAFRCRRRGESAQVSPRILRPVGGTCAVAAACAPDCSGRWSGWTTAGHSGGMRVRRGAAGAPPARGVRRRGRFPARTFPEPRPAAPRRPGRRAQWRVFRAANRIPDPQPKSRRAVGSRGPERARSGGDHLVQQALAGRAAVGAPSGGNLTFAPRQRSKHRRKSLRRLGAAEAARRRVKRAGLAPAWGGADVPKALRGDFHSLSTTTAAAREAGSRTLFTEPKSASNQTSRHRKFATIGIWPLLRVTDGAFALVFSKSPARRAGAGLGAKPLPPLWAPPPRLHHRRRRRRCD